MPRAIGLFALATFVCACSSTTDADPAPDAGPIEDAAIHDATTHDAGIADAHATDAADASLPACEGDGGIPDELRCTGLYADFRKGTISGDAHFYEPGYKLWSDGAAKRRWISLPAGAHIDTSDMDEWVFPVGTRVWKEFSLGSKIIETRYLLKTSTTKWTSAVYLWSDDQSTAHKTTASTRVPQPDGGPEYEVPAAGTCINCHAGRKDFILGFEAVALGVPEAGSTGGITLSTMPDGWLREPPPPIAIPDDDTNKAAAALGMLHMNCGVSCHNPGSGKASYTGLYMRLSTSQLAEGRVDSLDTYTTAVNVTGHLAFGEYKRIAPGDSAHSLVALMGLSRDPDAGAFLQMPPLLTHRPDMDPGTGMPAVQAWIDALP